MNEPREVGLCDLYALHGLPEPEIPPDLAKQIREARANGYRHYVESKHRRQRMMQGRWPAKAGEATHEP